MSFKNAAIGCIVIACGAVAVPCAIALWTGFHDDIRHADVGIVLASKVKPNGQPTRSLAARLDKTIELYRQGWFSQIIVSGGIGMQHENEAGVMRDYLIARGVPAAHIYADRAGITTYWTARNSSRLMREHGWKSAMVITQYFHIYRSKMAFEKFGIHPVYTAHANLFEWRDIISIPREAVGIYLYPFYDYSS